MKTTFIVPDTKQAPIVQAFECQLTKLAGGYTKHQVEGAWLDDDGSIVHDVSQEYSVSIADYKLPYIKEMVTELGAKLNQDCMYFETTKQEVTLLPCKKVLESVIASDQERRESAMVA